MFCISLTKSYRVLNVEPINELLRTNFLSIESSLGMCTGPGAFTLRVSTSFSFSPFFLPADDLPPLEVVDVLLALLAAAF